MTRFTVTFADDFTAPVTIRGDYHGTRGQLVHIGVARDRAGHAHVLFIEDAGHLHIPRPAVKSIAAGPRLAGIGT